MKVKLRDTVSEIRRRYAALPPLEVHAQRTTRGRYWVLVSAHDSPDEARSVGALIKRLLEEDVPDLLRFAGGASFNRSAAVVLGQRGGKRGGPARAALLSPERRREIARTAAQARWGNHSQQDESPPSKYDVNAHRTRLMEPGPYIVCDDALVAAKKSRGGRYHMVDQESGRPVCSYVRPPFRIITAAAARAEGKSLCEGCRVVSEPAKVRGVN